MVDSQKNKSKTNQIEVAIFTRAKIDRKCSSTATAELDFPKPYFPTSTEIRSVSEELFSIL